MSKPEVAACSDTHALLAEGLFLGGSMGSFANALSLTARQTIPQHPGSQAASAGPWKLQEARDRDNSDMFA